jgi:PAS domain-containing protein
MSALDPLPNGTYLEPDHDDFPTNKYDHHLEDDYDQPVSPLHMPPGQIDGLESLKADGFSKIRGHSPSRRDSSDSFHIHIPSIPSAAELALSALQYLPYPLMVLGSLKTMMIANEAMGRLMGIGDDEGDAASDDGTSALDRHRGQTLNQLGIDMLQDGRPVWVNWESFLDSLADDLGMHVDEEPTPSTSEFREGGATPTAEKAEPLSRQPSGSKEKSMVHDAVVEVVITQSNISASSFARKQEKVAAKHTFAKMIITVWEIEDEKFFTLTFTNTDSSQTSLPSSPGQSRQVTRSAKQRPLGSTGSGSHSSPSSVTSGRSSNQGGSRNSSAITSPTNASMSASPFPPLGPPSKTAKSSAPSSLQKVIMMKDALLDNTEVPILAMWKDESLTIPNRAARRLFHPTADLNQVKDGFDLVSKCHVWDETFTTRLDPSEYPISVLIRTQSPFSNRKIGIYDPDTERKIVFDCLGEAITDEQTGEFLAGIVTCRDITSMTQQINEIREKDDQRFQLVCDSMPQMIWTTSPEGMHDWFSQRWSVITHRFSAFTYTF